ncbi:MAG: hypothetical protein ACPGU6_02530 [Tenacibaculum sp.]
MILEKNEIKENSQGKLLEFPKVNVLEQRIDQVNEVLKVKRTYFLEKSDKETLMIYFTDHTGLRKVETAVWTVAENAIILKNTRIVPLSNIIAVA